MQAAGAPRLVKPPAVQASCCCLPAGVGAALAPRSARSICVQQRPHMSSLLCGCVLTLLPGGGGILLICLKAAGMWSVVAVWGPELGMAVWGGQAHATPNIAPLPLMP